MLLGQLEEYRFVVPDEVVEEITRAEQRQVLDAALAEGVLDRCSVDAIEGAALILELGDLLGEGELACLAVAGQHGWMVASDEKKRYRRETLARLGAARLIGTVELYLFFIRQNLVSMLEADADREVLASNNFLCPFDSFREIIA